MEQDEYTSKSIYVDYGVPSNCGTSDLMIKCGWGATEAAPVGLLITVVTGVAFYKADITLLASESAKGVWRH